MKHLVQLDDPDGYPPWCEPLQVLMDAELHEVPLGAELPESHFIQTKVHDETGPSEYTLHVYVQAGEIKPGVARDLLEAFGLSDTIPLGEGD